MNPTLSSHFTPLQLVQMTTATSTPPRSPPRTVEPSPAKKVKYAVVSNSSELPPENLMSNKTSVYIVGLQGGIDLIYFQDSASEGYIQPLVNILFKKQHTMPEIVKQNDLRKITDIVYVVPKRDAPGINLPKYKHKPGSNEKYKEHYFVRVCPKIKNTVQSRKDCLSAVVQFLNSCQAEQDAKNLRPSSTPYEVGYCQPNHNTAEHQKETWDQRMLDSDVGKLMLRLISPPPASDFFLEAGPMATSFFSEPYPEFARNNFGYRN